VKKWLPLGLAGLLACAVLAAGCQTRMGGGQSQSATEAKEQYPTKQIEIIVPFAAGGGVDLVARAVSEYVSQEWNQSVVVVNKPGGGGAVGAEFVLKQAKADGYTILADNVSSTSMLESGLKNPPVKVDDRILMARTVSDPVGFAVAADAPWKDFKEFSEWVRANPDQLTWTSVGPAGTSAFAVADWLKAIGADYSKTRMIATTGAADSVPKVAGGHAVLAAHTVAELYPMAQAGKIRILGIQAKQRSVYLPDVPTLEEQGIQGVTVRWWTGLSVPAGTPAHVVEKWEATLAKMVKDPAFLEKAKKLHVEVAFLNREAFTEFVKKETEYYTQLATERGMRK
jgi:tripartite-type tricarboxylate transporter receptor subunit TctC